MPFAESSAAYTAGAAKAERARAPETATAVVRIRMFSPGGKWGPTVVVTSAPVIAGPLPA